MQLYRSAGVRYGCKRNYTEAETMLQAERMQTNQKTEVEKFDEDIAFMLQVADGSEHAFRMLVGKWQKPIMNYFFRSCGDVHTSEDLAQQTFLNLFRARAAYAEYLGRDGEGGKPKAKFSTYLFHVARNVLISEFRKSARRPADATARLVAFGARGDFLRRRGGTARKPAHRDSAFEAAAAFLRRYSRHNESQRAVGQNVDTPRAQQATRSPQGSR